MDIMSRAQNLQYEFEQDKLPGGPGFDDFKRDGFEEDGECPNVGDCADQGRKNCSGCWRES
jgi:hypothetical protein